MVNNGLTYLIQEAVLKCQHQLASPHGNKEQRNFIAELLYSIFDLTTDFLICRDSCMSILRNETIVRSIFQMALKYRKEWSVSLNLSVVGICRIMTDQEIVSEQDLENFSEWGLPQVLLTLLGQYFKHSDNMMTNILLCFEQLIMNAPTVSVYLPQCELYQSPHGFSFMEILEDLVDYKNADISALALDILMMYNSGYGSEDDEFEFKPSSVAGK